MVSLVWAVYLIVAVTVDGHRFHGQHHSQKTTSIELDKTTEDIDIWAVDGIDQVDDMLLTEEQWTALRQRKAIKDVTKRWSEGPVSTDGSGNKYPKVPYVFQSDEPSFCKTIDTSFCVYHRYKNYCRETCGKGFIALPATLKPLIKKAIQDWEHHTCIEFEDITSLPESSVQRKKPHIQFSGGRPCSSSVGMINPFDAGQIINVGGCAEENRHGSRVHEIGHALGFFHEHSRSDRNEYIEVFTDNIHTNWTSQFYRINDDNHSIEYDYGSIMHYLPYVAYNSTNKPKVTIVPLDPVDLQLFGQRDELSFRDIHLANKMYSCIDKWETKCGVNTPRTCGEGYTGKRCKCICPPHKTGSQCEMEKPGSNGDYYYANRNQALNEVITKPMRLTVKVPAKIDVTFVKSIIPPKGKLAKVTFTSSNLNPNNCRNQFLYAVTNITDLEGKTLCDADLDGGEILTSDSKIIINTILRGLWHAVGTTLWEAEITFHDITGCAATTATTSTTTTATTATTTPPPRITTTKPPPTTTAAETTTTTTTSVTTPGYKPYPGKYWHSAACHLVNHYYRVVSCEACTMNCTTHDSCTAVHCVHSSSRGPVCQLLECPIPVPEPTWSHPGVTGYAIERGYKSYPGKRWSTSTCPTVKNMYKVESCEACTIHCTKNEECTAFSCGTLPLSTSTYCMLVECPIPAPEPTITLSYRWTGYAIE